MDSMVKNNSESNSELSLKGAQQFLIQILTTKTERFHSVADATDVRLEPDHLLGAALVAGEELVQYSVFPQPIKMQHKSRLIPRLRIQIKSFYEK